MELNEYIGNGQPWNLNKTHSCAQVLPPYERHDKKSSWYKGTANAIYQNIDFIDRYDPDYVVILSGDHIYKMDYSDMLRRHKEAGAACTISVMEVPWEEASRRGSIKALVETQGRMKMPRGTVWMAFFDESVQVNKLCIDATDPISAEPDFKKSAVRVTKA